MRIIGVNYDVGTPRLAGGLTRAEPSDAELDRDLALVAGGLGCGGVRISGSDPARLERAASAALRQGLAVWLSPALHFLPASPALDLLAEVGRSVARLRATHPDGPRVGVLTGCEVSFAMPGFLPGETFEERLEVFRKPWRLIGPALRHGSPARRLRTFLAEAVAVVREHTDAPVSYASGPWEPVGWASFDAVGTDHYLGRGGLEAYEKALGRLIAAHRPAGRQVIVTELGCATYTGAAERGGFAWNVLEPAGAGGQRVRPGVVRDEAEQARAVVRQLGACARAGVDEAYVFTFVAPSYPHDPADPARDLDIASYAVMATLPGEGPMPVLRPKLAFDAIAEFVT